MQVVNISHIVGCYRSMSSKPAYKGSFKLYVGGEPKYSLNKSLNKQNMPGSAGVKFYYVWLERGWESPGSS